MIDKPEIDAMAESLDVHTSNVQRDYAFGWLLAGVFEPSNILGQLLVLKGGNCFRKAYFETARYSGDLDFGTRNEIEPSVLLGGFKQACEFAKAQSGIQFLIDQSSVAAKRVDQSMSAFEARLYFQSFYGEHENLRLKVTADVKEFEQIYLPLQQRKLIHAYSDARLCQADITCLKLEELLAQKLKALLMRRHSPDLFDFVHSVFFQKVLSVSRLEILRTFYKLTVYENDPAVARDLLLALPFETIRGFWNQYLSCPKLSLFSFDDAAGWFKSIVADIFALGAPHLAGASIGGSGGFWARRSQYFSSEHRDLMFEAGRLQRLLKVRYDGFDRLVEPYALTFKKPKESAAREYFYVYDTTGGRDGKQSIKAFVADKLQAIESTEQEFEPRYPIELAKGGSHFGRSDFASSRPSAESFGRARRVRATPARGFGMTYKVQCLACGKIFSRSSVDTSLRAHKDKYGNDCYGRVGYLV